MKSMKIVVCAIAVMMVNFMAFGQTDSEMRMGQDIAVGENILSTLMKQQYGKRAFFSAEVQGTYMPGYGVTFKMPQSGYNIIYGVNSDMEVYPNGTYSYSRSWSSSDDGGDQSEKASRVREGQSRSAQRLTTTKGNNSSGTVIMKNGNAPASDSLAATANQRFIDVSKSFLADYGDVLSQLKPDERIVITNRGDDGWSFGFNTWGKESRRNLISVEAKRDDIMQLKQGKITKDQFLKKLTIVNSETSDTLDPDLEVLASMFSRLYREDLSKTYYCQGDVSYERLKDFGAIYYMRVYSSLELGNNLFAIPTLSVDNISQAERDKKVAALYPVFEKELKENVIEYGRTLRSLKDDEQVVMNVRLTKCVGCNIPAGIEVSVKNSVLKDYSAGKITKEAAIAKVNVKKTGNQ